MVSCAAGINWISFSVSSLFRPLFKHIFLTSTYPGPFFCRFEETTERRDDRTETMLKIYEDNTTMEAESQDG